MTQESKAMKETEETPKEIFDRLEKESTQHGLDFNRALEFHNNMLKSSLPSEQEIEEAYYNCVKLIYNNDGTQRGIFMDLKGFKDALTLLTKGKNE